MRRSWWAVLALAVPLAAVLTPVAAGATPRPATVTTCAAGPVTAPKGTTVRSVTATAHAGGTVTFPENPPFPPDPPIADVPAWCDVTVVVSHGGRDRVTITIALPQDARNWSGRFQGTGGSAYSAGSFGAPVVQAVKDGYVGAATDAGVGPNPLDATWGLTDDGTLLTNFATRSVHDLAVIGKDVAKRFYGRSVSYAYWTGCSTGGRQGYAEAQEHPRDFQGILANAPAIEWNRFEIATLWSQAVFHEQKVSPAPCELEAFNAAAVQACDGHDGRTDGLIDDPGDCHWDARRLVGRQVVCDGRTVTISRAVADAVNRIWAGPVTTRGTRLWYGPNRGASFAAIAAPGAPFVVPDAWARYFVTKDPSFDATRLTYASFERLFADAVRTYDRAIGTNEEDLSAFARSGGRLLTWHGQYDQLIPTRGTTDYYRRVQARTAGVDTFYRLFLIPGASHCDPAAVSPSEALNALVRWVEQGRAPVTLRATMPGGAVRDITRHR